MGWSRRVAVLLFGLGLVLGGLFAGAPSAQAEPGSAAKPVAEVPCPHFTDVSQRNQFAGAICWAAGWSLTTGTGDGSTYGPSEPVTRAQMAAFLYRLAGSPRWGAPAVSPFADVDASNQFYSAITWLYHEGITVGVEVNGLLYYQPKNAVNRASMAAFLRRLAGSPEWPNPATSPFADIGADSQFYNSVTWLAAQGVTVGRTVNGARVYEPANPVTRGSMAAFLKRMAARSLYCQTYPGGILCGANQTPKAFLRVAPSKLTLPNSGGSQTVMPLTNQTRWTASSSASWLTVTPAGGTNDLVTVTAATTTSTKARTATVTIKAGSLSQTVTVTQNHVPKGAIINSGRTGRWVEVDLSTQTTYLRDGDTFVNTFLVSTGAPGHDTPTGTFAVQGKYPVLTYSSNRPGDEYYLPNVKWNVRIWRGYLFHTAYWHNDFGHVRSHGCVNMREADAKKLYDFVSIGTPIVIHQ